MSVLEKKAENATVRWARDRGILVRKMNGLGFNHWPDRMFCIPGGKPVFIEFKKPGEEPTEMQSRLHNELREAGYDVQVTDSAEFAIDHLSSRLAPGAVSKTRRKIPAGARGRRPLPRPRNA